MEIAEESLTADETGLDTDALLKETWPVPEEDFIKEFEEYLLDIGVRI